MRRSKTPTYSVKARIYPTPEQEEAVTKMLNCYSHVHNVGIRRVKNLLKALEQDKRWQKLHDGDKMTPAEKKEAREMLKKYKLTYGYLDKYLQKQKTLFPELFNACISSIERSIMSSLDAYLYRNGEEIHFRQRRKYKTFSGTSADEAIRLKDGKIAIRDMRIRIGGRKNDSMLQEVLNGSKKIKYLQIKREWHKTKYRFYVIFYLEGTSPVEREIGNGDVGIDMGPSTIAADSEAGTMIQELASEVSEKIKAINKEIARLQRKADRQRRACNPENYLPDGQIRRNTKTFHRRWKKSRGLLKTEARIRWLYQKRTNLLNYSHRCLAKKLMKLGNYFITEDMYWAALQKKAKKKDDTPASDAKDNAPPDRKKQKQARRKRYGKSIENHAPSRLITFLKQAVEKAGGAVEEVNCFKTCATQYDHTTGEYTKHPRSERTVTIGNDTVQRDLHSAFNLRHIISYIDEEGETAYYYDNEAMNEHYPAFIERHNCCMQDIEAQRKAGKYIPASI